MFIVKQQTFVPITICIIYTLFTDIAKDAWKYKHLRVCTLKSVVNFKLCGCAPLHYTFGAFSYATKFRLAARVGVCTSKWRNKMHPLQIIFEFPVTEYTRAWQRFTAACAVSLKRVFYLNYKKSFQLLKYLIIYFRLPILLIIVFMH